MATLYLVSCVSKKLAVSAPARDLYISDWFVKAKKYVGMLGGPWYILSAKYGLLSPDAIIDPYEQTLNRMSVACRREWAGGVLRDLESIIKPTDHVVMLAGLRYREFILNPLTRMCAKVEVPMEGKPIGMQLSWLNAKNNG